MPRLWIQIVADRVLWNTVADEFLRVITSQPIGEADALEHSIKCPFDNRVIYQSINDLIRKNITTGSKYKLYLPTEEELREEIETQKAIFYLQQKDENGGEDDETTI